MDAKLQGCVLSKLDPNISNQLGRVGSTTASECRTIPSVVNWRAAWLVHCRFWIVKHIC